MSKKKFKFSIIVPIYNVEEYLRETIESVVNQTIGFEENIQLILVNDGSPDNSESICLEYKEKYPDNIVYIKQKNGGVSSARNNGMKYMEGEYINFLDSDDLWHSNALEKVYSFFELHKDEIDVVATRLEFFDAKSGFGHPLNFKFNKNCIVDLWEEPYMVQMHNSSCIIKRESIHTKFSTSLIYSEDSFFVNEIILEKMKLGLMSNVHYMYRKRINQSSAMDTSESKKAYYLNTIREFHKKILEISKEKYGKVPPYIQHCVMYDLQWRIKSRISDNLLNEKEFKEYEKEIRYLLKNIDNSIILSQNNLTDEQKIFALRIKDKNIISKMKYLDGKILIDSREIYSLQNKNMLTICFINIKASEVEIIGKLNCPFPYDDYKVYIECNGKRKQIKFDEKFNPDNKNGLFEEIFKYRPFVIREKINLNSLNNIQFFFKYKNEKETKVLVNFYTHGKLSRTNSLHYNKKGLTIYKKGETIKIEPYHITLALKMEFHLIAQLIKRLKIKQLLYRLIYHLCNIFKTKEIWLISDRISTANDNGMHFFKYVNSLNEKKKKFYFVIDKNCKDYLAMKKYGKVIAYNSFKYKIFFLLSNKIVSSQADEFLTNAFGKMNKYYRDLYNFDFVFLQHGIIKDDLSTWLNIYSKNIHMFVTSAQEEYDSIINGNYGFKYDVVKLTGLPRYDNLKNDPQKIIAIMPTWRQNISTKNDVVTGIRQYSKKFKESDYFSFYNKLINDKRLLNVMKKNGYKGIFVNHPSHVANSVDFNSNDIFLVNDGYADYQEIFKNASLMVSDFSSVPFDFAYLYKPVIYTQFDKETFFKSHTYTKGYFDYEKNGFGPVLYDYENTVNEIIKYIENGCVIEKKYKERIDKFYKYHDKKNCERVYKEINKL